MVSERHMLVPQKGKPYLSRKAKLKHLDAKLRYINPPVEGFLEGDVIVKPNDLLSMQARANRQYSKPGQMLNKFDVGDVKDSDGEVMEEERGLQSTGSQKICKLN